MTNGETNFVFLSKRKQIYFEQDTLWTLPKNRVLVSDG